MQKQLELIMDEILLTFDGGALKKLEKVLVKDMDLITLE